MFRLLIFGLAACSTSATAQVPPPTPIVIEHSSGYVPSEVLYEHDFRCSDIDRLVLAWRTYLHGEPGHTQRSAVIDRLDWSIRQPTPEDMVMINAAVAPYETPRSATMICHPEGDVLTLEFWNERNGTTRIAVRMSREGFSVAPVGPPQ